jgi:glycosyltransferase involved in cell wall biosynthesis
MRLCTGVVCHGPFLAAQLRTLNIARDRIREFEVDLKDFQKAAAHAPTHLAVRDFVRSLDELIVFVGRVQHNKGVFDLLEAFNRLRHQTDRRIGLAYVGDGKDLASLRVRVGELGRADSILLLGRVTHGELPGIMRNASVIVTPTRPEFPEGRCMVVLESLVLGVPVLAPDCGPFPFAINHEVNGLLFVPGDVNDLERCLLRVVTELDTRERLRRGAVDSATQIVAAHKSFVTAVELAFGPQPQQC